jgi:hypothetical protein
MPNRDAALAEQNPSLSASEGKRLGNEAHPPGVGYWHGWSGEKIVHQGETGRAVMK